MILKFLFFEKDLKVIVMKLPLILKFVHIPLSKFLYRLSFISIKEGRTHDLILDSLEFYIG